MRIKYLGFIMILAITLLVVACKPPVTEETDYIQEALDAISLPTSLTDDLVLPELEPVEGVELEISFSSSHPSVLSTAGVVNRQTEDVTVTFTVIVTLGDESKGKPFTIVVVKRDLTDQEIVDRDKAAFVFTLEQTTTNLDLPATYGDSTLTWISSKPEILSDNGTVTRPYGSDETVELTVTFTKGSATAQNTYDILVVGYAFADAPTKLSNVAYTLEQEVTDTEVNALLTITGSLEIFPNVTDRTITLVLYYENDTVLDTFENLATAGSDFEFKVPVNQYEIGWEWYKFSLTIEEDEQIRENILIPFEDEQSVVAVLMHDGDVRYFITVENGGYLNVKTDKDEDMVVTDLMRVIADYERLHLSSASLVGGYGLPQTTGEWGQGLTITWASGDTDYATIDGYTLIAVQSTPEGETIDLIATIASGEVTLEKTFAVQIVKGNITFENQTAHLENRLNDNNYYVDLIISGDVLNEDDIEYTIMLESLVLCQENGQYKSRES